MKKWLFNPFTYIAGGKALAYGLLLICAAAGVSCFTKTHFDGVLHMGIAHQTPMWVYFAEHAVCWLALVIVLFAGSKVFSKSKVRPVDMAGTLALARWPSVILALLARGMHIPNVTDPNELAKQISATTIVAALLSVVFLVWMVALFYNAFRVSANIKGSKGVTVFVAGLLVADLLSRIIISQIYKIA